MVYNEKKYEIVSLGCNCMPRTVLTRLGIKPRKAQGELSCPFDLVKHNSQRIIYYLETDFKDYLDDLHFIFPAYSFSLIHVANTHTHTHTHFYL